MNTRAVLTGEKVPRTMLEAARCLLKIMRQVKTVRQQEISCFFFFSFFFFFGYQNQLKKFIFRMTKISSPKLRSAPLKTAEH